MKYFISVVDIDGDEASFETTKYNLDEGCLIFLLEGGKAIIPLCSLKRIAIEEIKGE